MEVSRPRCVPVDTCETGAVVIVAMIVSLMLSLVNLGAAVALAVLALHEHRPLLWMGVVACLVGCVANIVIARKIARDCER